MKKFLRRLSRTQFLLIFFIPFGVWGFCYNGWLGLITSIVGYSLGCWLCQNWSRIKNYPWKKFFRQHVKAIVRLVILVPVVAAGCYYYGWRGLIASIAGLLVGEIICRRFIK
ncbi:MAG: hypothetical protein IJL12_02160 [Selenomonadaceae bacterium]|nr:hypothetical protein [Selenomonadaceae bacterium]MBQ6131131.1 hypothetical protein [Selenomonadaceae bacterium]